MSNFKHNSQAYRRSVKRTIELVKRLYGITGKIPRGNRYTTAKSAGDSTSKQAKGQRDIRVNPTRTLSCIRYLSTPMSGSSDNSDRSSNDTQPTAS